MGDKDEQLPLESFNEMDLEALENGLGAISFLDVGSGATGSGTPREENEQGDQSDQGRDDGFDEQGKHGLSSGEPTHVIDYGESEKPVTDSLTVRSALQPVQRVFSLEELDARPYYEQDFQLDDKTWSKLMESVHLLRSDSDKDNIKGCQILGHIMRDQTDPDSYALDVIAQRTVIELESLSGIAGPLALVNAAGQLLELLRSRDLEGAREDEADRREYIKRGWDGYATAFEHQSHLAAAAVEEQARKRRNRKIALFLLLSVGLAALGVLLIVLYKGVSLLYKNIDEGNCFGFKVFATIIAIWCAIVVPMTALTLNFVEYKPNEATSNLFLPPQDRNEKPRRKIQGERAAILAGLSLSVYLICLLSLGILWGNVVEFARPCTDLEQPHNGLMPCHLKYKCGPLMVADAGHFELVAWGVIFFMLISRMFVWVPRRRWRRVGCCCKVVYVPSMTRLFDYGFSSGKCCKPMFKDKTTAKAYLKSRSFEIALAAEDRDKQDSDSEMSDDLELPMGPKSYLTRRKERIREAAIAEYKYLGNACSK